jgi:hypothetical protein
MYTPSLKAAGRSGDRTGDLAATRAAGSPGPLGTPSPPGACDALERTNEQSQRDVSVYEGAFPIGDEILLHWVSVGTEGKEVLLYLASLAFLWTPWSLSLDLENVCKLM